MLSVLAYLIVIAERLVIGGWREGWATLWDRDLLAFFLVGMLLFGLGLVGEYVERIYQQVRARPRYTVAAVLEQDAVLSTSERHETLRPWAREIRDSGP